MATRLESGFYPYYPHINKRPPTTSTKQAIKRSPQKAYSLQRNVKDKKSHKPLLHPKHLKPATHLNIRLNYPSNVTTTDNKGRLETPTIRTGTDHSSIGLGMVRHRPTPQKALAILLFVLQCTIRLRFSPRTKIVPWPLGRPLVPPPLICPLVSPFLAQHVSLEQELERVPFYYRKWRWLTDESGELEHAN